MGSLSLYIYTFAHPFSGVHLSPILHSMDTEVDLRHGLLLLDGANSIVDLNVALIANVGCVGYGRGVRHLLFFGVHCGRMRCASDSRRVRVVLSF